MKKPLCQRRNYADRAVVEKNVKVIRLNRNIFKTPLKKCQLFRIIKLSLIRSKEEGLGLKVYPPSVELEIAV